MLRDFKFIKYASVYDETSIVYALDHDAFERVIDGVKFIEVTTDFKTAKLARLDSLKPVGHTIRQYHD